MEVIEVPIKDLKPNEKNPRRISKLELNKLIRSLKEFGFVDPIIVNTHKGRENIIIGGHQRVQASRMMGKTTVPVVYVDLEKDKEAALNIALNKISGDWDDEKLVEMLKELMDHEMDVTITGFDEPIIDEMLAASEESARDALIDVVPIAPADPKSKKGEVYLLGHHRLMCGDSTHPEDFERLMNQQTGDGCWTDPPYGVSYVGTNNPNGRDWGEMTNDGLRNEELYEFLKAIYTNTRTYMNEGSPLYTCYASINHTIFEKALNEAGFNVKQQLIWEKGHVLGRSDYHWSHEPILYCKTGDKNTQWFGDRTHKTTILQARIENLEELKKEQLIAMINQIRFNSDLIKEKKDPSSEYVHSTQKPVGLSLRMIKNSIRPRGIVIEPCAGSGSVLMACEVGARACYAMEIEPKYVDVILNRWSTYTQKDPIREGDKKKWSEINNGVQ